MKKKKEYQKADILISYVEYKDTLIESEFAEDEVLIGDIEW